MKSAEEWTAQKYRELNGTYSFEQIAEIIKAIQLDAWKEGMLEALSIHRDYPPSEHYECSKFIESQINNRTEV